MKKLLLLPAILAFLSACSDPESTKTEEAIVKNPMVEQTMLRGQCVNAANINPGATPAGGTGSAVTFTWNNLLIHDPTYTFTAYIEIKPAAAPWSPCLGTYPINATHAINIFGATSFVKNPGVTAGCFNWRIVVDGVKDFDSCHSETDWQYFHY